MFISEEFTQFDGNLLIGIQHALNADWLTPIMKFFSFLGEAGWFVILLCFIMVVYKKTRKLGLVCSVALLVTFIICNLVIKILVARTRPWVLFEGVNRMLADPGDSSFPSGHSTNCMAMAFTFWLYTRPGKTDGKKDWNAGPELGWNAPGANRKRLHMLSIATVIMALLIALSRLYLGMHFPADVICGLLLGMIVPTIVYAIFIKIEEKHAKITQQ